MNSEELELSLRTEFEEHLKSVLAGMRQEISQLQEKVEAEFEKHKSQLSEVFQDFAARIETEKELDAGFTESVVEHLRLARDEGARITATAIAEAEEMAETSAQEAAEAEPKAGISDLRDAINDISNQTSQSSILKTLVQHAAKFTARGAFFIIKNQHFVGWRVFGSQQEENDDKTIREIFFPVSSETVLGESVRSLSAVESSYGNYAADSTYIDKLEFGQPNQMFAVPLIARGRGVAVLYADKGEGTDAVNVEALETLVRVAGLTVELTASSQGGIARYDTPPPNYSNSAASVQPQKEPEQFNSEDTYQPETQSADSKTNTNYGSSFGESKVETFAKTNYQSPDDSFSSQTNQQPEATPQNFESDNFGVQIVQDEEKSDTHEFQTAYEPSKSFDDNYSWNTPEKFSTQPENKPESYQSSFDASSMEDFSAPATDSYQIKNNQYGSVQPLDSPQISFEETVAFDNSQFESSRFDSVETPQYESGSNFIPQTENISFNKEVSYDTFKPENEKTNDFTTRTAETVSQPTAPSPVKSRFSDRNVDLPIEVSEDERRLHNDARRFARLLVSEIKLYNEQKVKEGREARDLYERLREAIDRSREMYDKRVQPPVAAKFDYFHYELVSTLAEGEQAKLGASYTGAGI